KISFTSRLIDAVEDSGAWAGAVGGAASSARKNTAQSAKQVARTTGEKTRRFEIRQPLSASSGLEPERCLITHWGTIEDVTRWRRDPVSFGAVFDSAHK